MLSLCSKQNSRPPSSPPSRRLSCRRRPRATAPRRCAICAAPVRCALRGQSSCSATSRSSAAGRRRQQLQPSPARSPTTGRRRLLCRWRPSLQPGWLAEVCAAAYRAHTPAPRAARWQFMRQQRLLAPLAGPVWRCQPTPSPRRQPRRLRRLLASCLCAVVNLRGTSALLEE